MRNRKPRPEPAPRAPRWQEECAQISRRKAKARRALDIRRRLLVIAACVLPAYAGLSGWLLWRAGGVEEGAQALELWAYDLSRRAGFEVRRVVVVGAAHLPAESVARLAGIMPGDSLFRADVRAAQQRLESLAEVRSASFERRLPDTIRIVIEERTPFALWQHDGVQRWLDRDGTVLTHQARGPQTGDLVLTGEDAPQRASELFALINASPLKAEILSAQRVGGRRWDIVLRSGLRVKLPQEEMAQAWARLEAMAAEHELLKRPLLVVDLRLPDRAILTPDAQTPIDKLSAPAPSEDI